MSQIKPNGRHPKGEKCGKQEFVDGCSAAVNQMLSDKPSVDLSQDRTAQKWKVPRR